MIRKPDLVEENGAQVVLANLDLNTTRVSRDFWGEGVLPVFDLQIPLQEFQSAKKLYGLEKASEVSEGTNQSALTCDQIASLVAGRWVEEGFGFFRFTANFSFQFGYPRSVDLNEYGLILANSLKSLLNQLYGITDTEHYSLMIRSEKKATESIYTVDVLIVSM